MTFIVVLTKLQIVVFYSVWNCQIIYEFNHVQSIPKTELAFSLVNYFLGKRIHLIYKMV